MGVKQVDDQAGAYRLVNEVAIAGVRRGIGGLDAQSRRLEFRE